MSIFLSKGTSAISTFLSSDIPTKNFATSSRGEIVALKPIFTGQILLILFSLSNDSDR